MIAYLISNSPSIYLQNVAPNEMPLRVESASSRRRAGRPRGRATTNQRKNCRWTSITTGARGPMRSVAVCLAEWSGVSVPQVRRLAPTGSVQRLRYGSETCACREMKSTSPSDSRTGNSRTAARPVAEMFDKVPRGRHSEGHFILMARAGRGRKRPLWGARVVHPGQSCKGVARVSVRRTGFRWRAAWRATTGFFWQPDR